MTALDPQLISMLRCPVTKSKLAEATEPELKEINQKIESGSVLNHLGQTVETTVDGGLINEGGNLMLPVRGGIVILVVDQAIRMEAK